MKAAADRVPLFQDRTDAGQKLARLLGPRFQGRPDVLVLGLARGGVPVAHAVATALQVSLDVFLVRKLGVPGYDELAMGALAHGGIRVRVRVINQDVVRGLGISTEDVEAVTARESRELERRERAYRGDRAFPEVAGKTVILVDDGLATGASMRAAVRALRQLSPARLVVAVPVAAPQACEELRVEADEVVCAETPERFEAVGLWYRDFAQTGDDEVRRLLAGAP